MTTNYTLDLNTGLTQVLQDGTNTYVYGVDRIAQVNGGIPEYFLTDGLGSVRQLVDSAGNITLAKNYEPYGMEASTAGSGLSSYGFTGEMTDSYIKLIYLRSWMYDPATGRFQTKDTWVGDYNKPMSYNAWLYVYANPVNIVDPSGLMPTVYGIEVDDKFSEDEKKLILETLSDYAGFLGGNDVLKRNLALTEIRQDWLSAAGAYNAAYNYLNQSITLQPGWYSSVITTAPNGQVLVILGPPCFEEMLDFPKGSLPTAEIGAKFVLAHEMTHALAFGNPNTFSGFRDNVDLPWSIFAWLSSNPLIRRNSGRSLADEVFADVIPAYIYSPGLLNQQMSDWVQNMMPSTLK